MLHGPSACASWYTYTARLHASMLHAHGTYYTACDVQMFTAYFHRSMFFMLPVSPSSSALCGTSTSRATLCTSRASCPDTHSSDGRKPVNHTKQQNKLHAMQHAPEHDTAACDTWYNEACNVWRSGEPNDGQQYNTSQQQNATSNSTQDKQARCCPKHIRASARL